MHQLYIKCTKHKILFSISCNVNIFIASVNICIHTLFLCVRPQPVYARYIGKYCTVISRKKRGKNHYSQPTNISTATVQEADPPRVWLLHHQHWTTGSDGSRSWPTLCLTFASSTLNNRFWWLYSVDNSCGLTSILIIWTHFYLKPKYLTMDAWGRI